jgi:O-methyltransferase
MVFRMKQKIKNKVFGDSSKNLINTIKPYTMCSEERIESLIKLAEYVNSEAVEGDFVECGTYKGGTAAVLSRHMGKARHLWLYDSFEGMPNTSEKDGEEAKKWIGDCVGSVKDVREVMKLVSANDEQYTIKKGWFDKTFQEPLPKKVALLHCDADWYDSVLLVLDNFYKLIPEGGCIVLDDFGYWEGCREAFYDFCLKNNERPLLERVGTTQAYWIKGRMNNRVE